MLKRGQDEVRGSYISYDVGTEFFQVTGGATKSAKGQPGDGRVRAIMQPTPKDKPAAAPAVPLKSDAGSEVQRGEVGAASR
jgi:lipopolysaccharide export system protein LptA